MSGTARYLWGRSKVGYLDFDNYTSLPTAKAGRLIYYDSHFRFCEDGTNYLMVRDVLHN